MYIYSIQINKEENLELITEEKLDKEILINKFISEKDKLEFYKDTEKFIEEKCSLKVRKGIKCLYLIYTDKSGYDTYDSAVYCAYTEKQVIQLSEVQMGGGWETYHNNAEFIGTAHEDLRIGEVVSSFNAG